MYFSGTFDRTVGVLVIGFGDAGAIAAITSHELGAETLIVEKQSRVDRRPNSRYAEGYFLVPNDVAGAAKYLSAMYGINGEANEADPAVAQAWAEETATNLAWLEERGGRAVKIADGGEHPDLDGCAAVDTFKFVGSNEAADGSVVGCPLFGFLDSLVRRMGIECMFGTRAEWLVTDETGAVTGVRVRTDAGQLNIGVTGGVVLATGGYEANERMKRQYLPVSPVHFYGSRHSLGEGVSMAIDVGAELWHMNTWPGHLVAHFPESGYAGGCAMDYWGFGKFARPQGAAVPGFILVDRTGRRFMQEPNRQHAAHLAVHGMDVERLAYPRIPTWWIFDEKRMTKAPLIKRESGPAGPVGDLTWSDDNRAELARGWIYHSDTVRGLAEVCGMDGDVFEQTLQRYNAGCASGHDDEFGRPSDSLAPICEPPYYAVPLWPGGSHTVGGPRRNADCQVLSVRGGTIGNLFSAGELGSVYGLLYPVGGGSLAECLASGRVAGRAAARAAGAK